MMNDGRCGWHEVVTCGTPPTKRYVHTAVIWHDNMYIFGGHHERETNVNDLYELNIPTRHWKQIFAKGSIPLKRNGHSACVYKDSMFVFGGYSGLMFNDFYEFQFKTKTWKNVHEDTSSEYPAPRCCHSMVLYRDCFYIFGGDGGVLFNDLWCYNLLTNKWHQIKNRGEVPAPRRYHSCVVYKDNLFIFGGRYQTGRFNNLYQFSFVTQMWMQVNCCGDIPSQRAAMSAVVLGDAMYIFGGFDGAREKNDFYKLDLLTFRWKKIECKNPPLERENHTAVVYSNSMIIFGGFDLNHKMHNSTYMYVFEPEKYRVPDTILAKLKSNNFVDIYFE